MKLIFNFLFAGTSLFLLAANAYPQSGNTCPPPGTEVPFAKVINPAFASDYVGCDITVRVQFFSSTANPFHWDLVKGTSGKVPFQVVVPGQLPTSPQVEPHVFLPKDKADVIFSMKVGDLILIRGALGPDPVVNMMGHKQKVGGWPPAFIASDLISASAPDAAIKEMTQREFAAAPVLPPTPASEAIKDMPEIKTGQMLGVYWKTPDGKWTSLELLMSSGQENRGFVGKGFVTYRGAESRVHLSDRRPVIFIQSFGGGMDAKGWRVLPLGKKGDHRELQTSQETMMGERSGESFNDKKLIGVVVKTVAENVSSVTPAADLVDGEYVLTNGLYQYDFGIGK
jgi:hypothetical protein